MVFCGIYPVNSSDYGKLTKALEKFQLNDSSLVYTKESSAALGHGYRLGFMGMLHMEIAIERLKREYGQELIATVPSVAYKIFTTDRRGTDHREPLQVPRAPHDRPHRRADHQGPGHRAQRIRWRVHGPVRDQTRDLVNMEHPDRKRALLTYDFPLAEMITGYFDKLKSVSRGYADMDYELAGYRRGDLVKVDVLVKGNQVDALSFISTRDERRRHGPGS